MQIDGHPGEEDDDSPTEKHGFLSTLLGNNCECHGYKLIIVGHSLGGAVATLLGIRLYARYPNLHVYAYGALSCVDLVIAEACSDFVSSIVYNDQFSARFSVNSILRLRAASIAALSDDASAYSALISKLARRVLNLRKSQENGESRRSPSSSTHQSPDLNEDTNHQIYKRRPLKYAIDGGAFLCGHAVSCIVRPQVVDGMTSEPGELSEKDPYHEFANEDGNGAYECSGSKPTIVESSDDLLSSFKGQTSAFVGDSSTQIEVSGDTPEVFLAGLIIHIIPEERNVSSQWKRWLVDDRVGGYKAFLAERENFKDIVVSPYMFLDHLPWRCHYALQRVLETRKLQMQLNNDLSTGGEVLV